MFESFSSFDDEIPPYLSLLDEFERWRRDQRKRIAGNQLQCLRYGANQDALFKLKQVLHGEIDVMSGISPETQSITVVRKFLKEVDSDLEELKQFLRSHEGNDGFLDVFSAN